MGATRGVLMVGLCVACAPLRDLDEATRGNDGGAGATSTSMAGLAGATLGESGADAVATNGGRTADGLAGGGTSDGAYGGSRAGAQGTSEPGGMGRSPTTAGSDSGANAPIAGESGTPGSGGAPSAEGGAVTGGVSVTSLGGTAATSESGKDGHAGAATAGQRGTAELPIDLPNSPVTGTFTVSSDATWEVNGTQVPTFEIHTPTASYWVVKSLAMIVSIVETKGSDQRQWIDFSTGFRPQRGLPSYASFGTMEAMSTTLDIESQTPTHLRLLSASQSGSWRLVWDFYPTHVTVTVTAAPVPYGFAYRGVPAGLLGSEDRYARGDGSSQSANISSVADLDGPAEWAYLSDSDRQSSLFFIQHGDDSLADRYQVKDNDSALLSFGDGMLRALPMRFSFGVIGTADYQAVKARANFVIDAIY